MSCGFVELFCNQIITNRSGMSRATRSIGSPALLGNIAYCTCHEAEFRSGWCIKMSVHTVMPLNAAKQPLSFIQ